jgi:FKBP-type peptidyl-prolyl cis-trans isomerase FklB
MKMPNTKNTSHTSSRMLIKSFATILLTAAFAVGVALAQQGTAPASGAAAQGQGTAATPPAKSSATPAASAAAKPRTGTTARSATPLVLKTDKDKASYAIGLSIGKSMKKDSVEVDTSILARGVRDGMTGAKPLLTDAEANGAMTVLQGNLRKKQEAMMAVLAESNKREGDAFLAANKSQDGVTTLPDGLQYKILRAGDGPKPSASDSVVCNYRGMLLNNKEFDSSYKRGQPATFPVGGVIKGWTEALQLMPVGSKWQLFVPPDLAYGPKGAGADIGPNSTLIFEVELISIQAKDAK